jgi:hypothetical protein
LMSASCPTGLAASRGSAGVLHPLLHLGLSRWRPSL